MSHSALIVCAAAQEGADDVVRGGAAEVDLVIAVDGGAETCLSAGVRPDLVVGDLDSLDSATADELRALGVEFVVFPVVKDETDLDLALMEARARGFDEVTVTGAFSGRLDHTLAAIGSVAGAADLFPMLREPLQSGWILSANQRDTVRIGPEGTTFSVIAVVGRATVSIAGSQWELDRAELAELDSVGVSNTVHEGAAVIRVHEGTVLVWTP